MSDCRKKNEIRIHSFDLPNTILRTSIFLTYKWGNDGCSGRALWRMKRWRIGEVPGDSCSFTFLDAQARAFHRHILVAACPDDRKGPRLASPPNIDAGPGRERPEADTDLIINAPQYPDIARNRGKNRSHQRPYLQNSCKSRFINRGIQRETRTITNSEEAHDRKDCTGMQSMIQRIEDREEKRLPSASAERGRKRGLVRRRSPGALSSGT